MRIDCGKPTTSALPPPREWHLVFYIAEDLARLVIDAERSAGLFRMLVPDVRWVTE